VVKGVAFSPDGTRLASAGWEGHGTVWDTGLGVDLLTLRPLAGRPTCIAWGPDGTRIAAGANDGTVYIWDATPCAL
jgi:WD40 repeat protein